LTTFLDLGRQPIANGFLTEEEFEDEFFYDLTIGFDKDTGLVSLGEFVPPERMFNENYAYHTSQSFPMVRHFEDIAIRLQKEFEPRRVIEIGSNDGSFLKHWNEEATGVEPCSNFATMTEELGYRSYPRFWDIRLGNQIRQERGAQDLVYAANCICHIQNLDDCFTAVEHVLSDDGIFVFEDPSLQSMIARNSYDQIYDEHAHIFSVIALSRLLKEHGLKIFRVEKLTVHGGSNRIYAAKNRTVEDSYYEAMREEQEAGLNTIEAFNAFAEQVKRSKTALQDLLEGLESDGKRVCSIGATSKSTTVFNYCRLDRGHISHVIDTTPAKIGKFTPGSHIPIIDHKDVSLERWEYVFLGAWNFKDVIMKKEHWFTTHGGRFITHVPEVQVI
jgi:methylation protein EvaC